MTRNERRALQAELRKQALAWPEQLVPVPQGSWPAPHPGLLRPLAVWRSRYYLAVVYPEKPLIRLVGGEMHVLSEMRRMTVNRVTMGSDGQWDANIPWEDLQRCKREAGLGDWYGVEVYPRERDIVNDCNMRHLWLLAEPLGIGWFAP